MLEVEQLAVSFVQYASYLSRGRLTPVRAMDLSLGAGEIVALVGESGAGKSLLAHAILGLLPQNASVSGVVRFCGEILSPSRAAKLRGRQIALIPQSVTYLNPLRRVGRQVRRAARLSGVRREAVAASTRTALGRYGLEPQVEQLFPFQLSGGMSKRVLTAAATVGAARLILADEPTAGLDRDNSAKMLSFLRRLSDGGRSVLLITHNLDAALQVADKVAVVQDGMTVEMGSCRMLREKNAACHPYSRLLFDALPQNGFTASVNGKKGATGANSQAKGCVFYSYCSEARVICLDSLPPRKKTEGGWVRCHAA